MVTVAPGTTPLASLTVPTIVPVVTCAATGEAARRRATRREAVRRSISSSSQILSTAEATGPTERRGGQYGRETDTGARQSQDWLEIPYNLAMSATPYAHARCSASRPSRSHSPSRPFSARQPAQLKVSENKRFLVTADGQPFFWLGDTAWELFHRPTREDACATCASAPSSASPSIQAVALAEFDGLQRAECLRPSTAPRTTTRRRRT